MLSSWWEIEESKGSPSDGLIWAQQNFINSSSHNHKSIHSSTFLFFPTCHPFKIQFTLLFVHSSAYTSIKAPIHLPSYSSPFPIHLLLHLSNLSYPSTLPYPSILSSVHVCMQPSTLLSIHCSTQPSIRLSIHPFTHPYPICPPIHPLSHLYLLPLIHPSIPLSISRILTSTTSILPPTTPPSGHLNVQN